MAYYFGITDETGEIVETIVDLHRRFPKNKFSNPPTNHDLSTAGVVKIFRRENIHLEWPYIIKRTYIENDNGVFREKAEIIEVTNPELLARAKSHIEWSKDNSVTILSTSEISNDSTLF